MKSSHFRKLALFGLKTIVFGWKKPILGTIILTDRCNLSCKHCAVNNVNGEIYPYTDIRREMQRFYEEGIRILFFCGGETMLWESDGRDIHDLILEARHIGFFLVNVVTNGTMGLELPEASVVFLSLDGMRRAHNAIRGDTFDTIVENLDHAGNSNICIYAAINRLNYGDILGLARFADEHPAVRSISFNFHTPYSGTEELALSRDEKVKATAVIKYCIDAGYPVFNLRSVLDTFLSNTWPRPCYQCVVSEEGRRYVCGRCVEIDGLCEECGYLFAAEFAMLFRGKPKVVIDMVKTYRRYA